MTQPEVNLSILVVAVVLIGTPLVLIACCAMAGAFKQGGKNK